MMGAGLIMPFQQVLSEVVFKVTPDGVDMVRPVLRVIQFDEKRWAVNPVVMR